MRHQLADRRLTDMPDEDYEPPALHHAEYEAWARSIGARDPAGVARLLDLTEGLSDDDLAELTAQALRLRLRRLGWQPTDH